MSYDAIIAGASFAGLAVASELKGDILLLDKKVIGTEQTSACDTFYTSHWRERLTASTIFLSLLVNFFHITIP